MKTFSKRATLRATSATMMLGAALLSTAVSAQEAEDGASDDTIVVTGSRIVRSELENTVPTLVIGDTLLNQQGFENVADIATSLPQFAPAFGSARTQSTFSGAVSSGLNVVNLRNLGAGSTLVLINGRRAMAGSPTSTAVDMNTMPSANIERIELLTGGASAIYGADAVAGVVNIITKKNFEGFEVGASYGLAERGDNINPNGYLMFGSKFGDGGHFLLTAQYDFQGEVKCADRFLCAEDFAWTSPATQVRGPAAYSGVGSGGRFFIGSGSYTVRNGSAVDANGAPIPFAVATDGYNRNGNRDLAIPTRRLMVAGEVEYPVADNVKAFLEFNYGNSQTTADFEGHPFQSQQPGSLFGGGPGVAGLQATIPANNPFIPSALAALIPTGTTEITWWQRFNALGDRGATNERTMARVVAGFQGDFETLGGFGNNWNWEASYTYGTFKLDSVTDGLVGTDRLYYGLRVEQTPGAAAGTYRCVDAGARAAGCVPINPFAPYTQQMIDYLVVKAGQTGKSVMHDAQAWISGELFDLPAGSVRAAFGAEYRTFSGFLDYDESINRALVTGNQTGDVSYIKTRTREVYGEVIVPILSDTPVFERLDLEGAFRLSKASRTGSYNTWKYGGTWEPFNGIRFRAMKARAVRAPVPGELSGIGQNFGVVNDPCTASRRNLNATRAANCSADGVPTNYTPALVIEQGVGGVQGGNPNLKPEEATTLTYGVVFAPEFLPGFTVTIDRFEIDVTDQISTVGRQIQADLCYDTADRQFCNNLVRGTSPLLPGANYVLRTVNDQLQNVASTQIKGYDIDARYTFDLTTVFGSSSDLGKLGIQMVATVYDKAEKRPLPTGAVVVLTGAAGGSTTDQGFLDLQANFNFNWTLDDLSVLYNMRYLGEADMSPTSTASGFPRVSDAFYHNLRIDTKVTDSLNLYAGVTNLFDKSPPFFATGTAGTQALDTIPGYYDVFGRSFYVGFKVGL